MKRLTNLVPAIFSATTATTETPAPPALRTYRRSKKNTAHLQKLQEDVSNTRICRVHGFRGKLRQTLAKMEDQSPIGYNRAHRKER